MNVGRGLSLGPMLISSSSSTDVNPYPSFLSPVKSAIGKECDRKSFGRSLRLATLLSKLMLETLQLMYGIKSLVPPSDCCHYVIHLALKAYILFFGADHRDQPCQVYQNVLSSVLHLLCEAGG
jgi:hypothetical protein